jgi:phage terminase large subunit GpA-like protein
MREWAEQELIVPNGPYAGEPFRANLIPWTRLFLDEVDTGRWHKIAGTGCTQAGKTLVLHAIPVLYHLFEVGETVVEGVPDMYMGADKWREDLLPVIQASPALREQLPTRGAGSKGGKAQAIQFRHGATLRFMTGGGSDAGRKGFTSRVLAVTEVDELACAGGTSTEADKLTQLEGRLRAFLRLGAREYLESTPTIEAGRIWQEIKHGTDSRILRPCPHCGAWVAPEREHLVGWQDAEDEHAAKENAAWSCPNCAERWTEAQQLAANQAGVLVHRGQTVSGSGRVEGPLPRTDCFGFRFSAVDNYFVSAGVLGQELWKAARAIDQDNAERYLAQQVFALPWAEPDWSLTPLDPAALNRRVDEYNRGIIPPDALGVAVGIDTGKRVLHWTGIATPEEAGRHHVIDYGEQPTPWQTMETADSLVSALRTLHGYLFAGWQRAGGGDPVTPDVVWVDAGYSEHKDGIYRACEELNEQLGRQVYLPTLGHGEGERHVGRYTPPRALSRTVRAIGRHYHVSYLTERRTRVCHLDGDFWKTQVHEGLAAPIDDPRALVLFAAPSPTEHAEFNAQITAEEQLEEFVPGKGMRRRWERKRRQNHFLDSTYGALAGCEHLRTQHGRQQAQQAARGGAGGAGWFAQQTRQTRRRPG